MVPEVVDFSEAWREAQSTPGKKHILLGNGFSVACHSQFGYGTLSEQAEAKMEKHVRVLFKRYGNNFEEILKHLDEGSFLAKHYGLIKSKKSLKDMDRDYKDLKKLLVATISSCHPDFPNKIPDKKFDSSINFLKQFDTVYTLNYDLLLYWSAVHIDQDKGEEFPFEDCFGRDEDPRNPDCSFTFSSSSSAKYLFFLHGALHLYAKDAHVWKRVWNTKQIPLIKQIREAFNKKEYPLIVAEGDSADKAKRIESSSYLSQAFRKFKNIQGSLFVFGHSLSDQDNHIFEAIIHNEKYELGNLWVGIYGDEKSKVNKTIIQKALSLELKRDAIIPKKLKEKGKGGLKVNFYRSKSAKIWG